jgi:beta-aspartyl-dipeptidase (metallo-type)
MVWLEPNPLLPATPIPSVLTLLRQVNLFAPEAQGVCDILVAGRSIAAIGPSLPSLPPALDAQEVDCRGARAIPGLIDAHVHLTGGGGEAGPSTRVPRPHLSQLTRAGITTVIGVLGTDGTSRSVAELVSCTLGLRAEGLSAWCYTGSYQVPLLTLTGSVRSDLAYVDPIIGVGELALSDHRSSQPTFDELLRIASDCHVGGMISGKAGVLHLHMGDGLRGLALVRRALEETELPAHVFWPTHVNRNKRLFAEALELATRGLTIDITAFPPAGAGEDELPAADAIVRCLDAGLLGRVTCSSDGAGCLPTFDGDGRLVEMGVGDPQSLTEALKALLERKVPLDVALGPFTSDVADKLRLPHKGRLRVGDDADIVLLDDKSRVGDVMAGGKWLVRNREPVQRGVFERKEGIA